MSAKRISVLRPSLENSGLLDCNSAKTRLRCWTTPCNLIADIGTGVVYGYEAQIRNCKLAGAASADDLIDQAYQNGFLPQLEAGLLRKAINRFKDLKMAQGTKLYFKLDGRDLGQENDPRLQLDQIASEAGLDNNQICLEFSERHQQTFSDLTHHAVNGLRQLGFLIALDDFGRGSSELRLLHDMSPDYVKIDRFFLNGIDSDPRRKLFVTTVANLAHVLGARVIAEGVETEPEFKACREAGCDLIQGAFCRQTVPEGHKCEALLRPYPGTRTWTETPRRAGPHPQRVDASCRQSPSMPP